MTSKLVRIKCRPQKSDASYRYEVMLDAVIQGDNMRDLPWLGTAHLNGIYPFRLELDGRINFGSGYEGIEQYWKTTLRNKAIRVAEDFSIIGIGGGNLELMYEIIEVHVLLADSTESIDVVAP